MHKVYYRIFFLRVQIRTTYKHDHASLSLIKPDVKHLHLFSDIFLTWNMSLF